MKKAEQRALDASWESMKAQFESLPKFGGKYGRLPQNPRISTEGSTTGRVSSRTDYPSLVTPGGSTALKPNPEYTGDAMLGVAVMHKSNAVPVFSTEEATDVAKMRRG